MDLASATADTHLKGNHEPGVCSTHTAALGELSHIRVHPQ